MDTLDFVLKILKNIIISITLGFILCAVNRVLSPFQYGVIFEGLFGIGFFTIVYTLVAHERQNPIKLFNLINMSWIYFLVFMLTILCVDSFIFV
ncbi:hypothetical protein [Clostridium fungisolvens]|uniref:Uncharacterized protein n=1 Tax=Clostridium fungisolvens TaxID=1604897 RepID=A0A6V8SDU2_9CLOT|nr:hypothetical protein [Clostridium fungisolvens]GFP75399.1 hypothetical protein bsdtw1_01479 [Clostridium fungisolvens]